MPATTALNDAVAGVYAILAAYATANPTLLRSSYRQRPSSPQNVELPCAYVGSRTERLVHTSGIRTRDIVVMVEVIDHLADAIETADRLDDLTDALVDEFTSNYHGAGAGTILAPETVERGEDEIGDAVMAVARIGVRVWIGEGRT